MFKFKSVYEFTKGFSALLFLCGVFFLFREMYLLAFLSLFSFFGIKFIDSDWAFDHLKFSNHNMVVIITTFVLIFVNLVALYQEMRYSPLLTRVTAEDKQGYIVYENALFSSIEPCVNAHNTLIDRMNSNIPIYDADVKRANNFCYGVIEEIDKQVIPDNFSAELKMLCSNEKEEMKKIAVNLATYAYSVDNPQSGTIIRVKQYFKNLLENMAKTREIMHMTEDIGEKKRTFVKI